MSAKQRRKSFDIAHSSMSQRATSRASGSNIVPRHNANERSRSPRPHNFTRYSRYGVRHMKPEQTEFRIRTSVADLVMKELEEYDRCIFYQRVYILAKDAQLTVTAESSVVSMLNQYVQSKATLSTDSPVPVEYDEEQDEERELSGVEFDEFSQEMPKSDTGESVTVTVSASAEPTSKEEPLLTLTKADFEQSAKEKRMQQVDFFDQFKDKIDQIVKKCEYEQLSEDRFTGLLLCMGNSHTLFVLEGPEDTIALFCQELLDISTTYFEVMRVFAVEDRIEETFFDEFLYRRSVAMNINEKFPPSTPNDQQLMAAQHWLMLQKLHILCQTLSNDLRPKAYDRTAITLPPIVPSTIEAEKRMSKIKRKSTLHKIMKHSKTEVAAPADVPPPSLTVAASLTVSISDSVQSRKLDKMNSVRSVRSDRTAMEDDAASFLPPAEPLNARTSFPIASTSEMDKEIEDISKTFSSVRLQSIATVLGENIVPVDVEEEELQPKEIFKPDSVNPSVYNRLLPEVQRIELVLASKRFYLDLAQFVPFSQEIPMQLDEDAQIWPTSYNYLPLNVFERLPYDVNLTFGNYDAKEEQEVESDSSEDEGKGEKGNKDDKGDKKEG